MNQLCGFIIFCNKKELLHDTILTYHIPIVISCITKYTKLINLLSKVALFQYMDSFIKNIYFRKILMINKVIQKYAMIYTVYNSFIEILLRDAHHKFWLFKEYLHNCVKKIAGFLKLTSHTIVLFFNCICREVYIQFHTTSVQCRPQQI